ncbi:MAG: FMN-binding protein [Clostridia bacterium]|nr:FMN-binding protein [Clostridia bacterium]
MKKNKKPEKQTAEKPVASIPYVKIVLCLFFICTICAGLLGATFLLTKDPIAANEKATIESALKRIYGDKAVLDDEAVPVPEGQNVEAIYLLRNPDGALAGYAVRVLSAGFSADIDMIVGFDADSSIRKVEIIALSETAGLGSRVAEEEYLTQYVGTSGELVLKEDIDAISGATKSSKAVINGVNAATRCLAALGV